MESHPNIKLKHQFLETKCEMPFDCMHHPNKAFNWANL